VSTERDVTRIVRSWMDEGVTQLPDRVLDLVLDQIPATPQRHASWLARRFPPMNTYARLGLIAAAVLAVAIVGIGLFGRSTDVGPTTSQSPSLAASPPAAVNPLVGTWLAPEVTCAQQVATVEAAGYTPEQMIQAWAVDPTCPNGGKNQYSVVFDGLPVAATIRSARAYDYDVVASPHSYRVVDDSTLEFGAHDGKVWGFCLTLRYTIVGDQLTIARIAPSCTGTGDAPILDQIALTAILETTSFTRQP
jgi:hypothetical protein